MLGIFAASRRIARLCAAMLILTAGAAVAQEPAQGFGVLAQYLPKTGRDDTWRYAKTADSFEIENIGDPGAITYFFLGPRPGSEGRRVIETRLAVHPDSRGSAGLIYGLDRERGVYHMLTLDAAGKVTLFRRDGDGFRPMLEQTSGAYLPGKVNRLKIAESGDEIALFLNEAPIGRVGGDLFGFGGVGIGAVGDVRAIFDMFSEGDGADGAGTKTPERTPPPKGEGKPEDETRNTPDPDPDDALHLRPVQIMDPQGPAGQPMVAYRTMLPADWTMQGGVLWNESDGRGRCFTGARLVWGATSPDKAYSVSFLDPVSWGVTSAGPATYRCVQADLADAEAVTRQYLDLAAGPLNAQGVTMELREIDRPAELRPLVETVARNWVTTVPGAQAWSDGAMARTRMMAEGQPLDGALVVVTNHLAYSGPAGGFRAGQSALIVGFTTPRGKLEQGHPGFAAILNNLRADPAWVQIEARWWQQKRAALGGQINAQTRAAANTGKSIGDSMFESWQRRQGMRDAGQNSTINGIWEVQPWKTPGGGTMLLNQNYAHAWQLQNGAVVLTNNANFNPMSAYNQPGQELRRGG